ncbi:tyrosine-type recombinase/integrase (plasmid) [Haloferax sp. S1W]|uniref:tyrosine-type recombinase/integrase n=1 Tax=Haloferax sp. S1W TaxID=3377110 RepID=UPI0037C5FFF3
MTDSQKSQVDAFDPGPDTPTWLKPEQVNQLLDATIRASPDYLQLRDQSLVLLAYDTGLRVSELVALDVDDVDLDDNEPYVFVDAEIQKGSHARDTPIELRPSLGTARTLATYLSSRWKDSPALFPARSSERMSTTAVRNVVTKLATEADVSPRMTEGNRRVGPEHVSPHSLRHSLFYREFVVDERRLKEVSLRLRHESISTTEEFYSHLIRV